jgi:ribosomal protein L11 methyltransferase
LAATPAHSLLDVGCGSGVLSLAAAALGVPMVAAVDISRPAASATRRNARENHPALCLTVIQGSTECLRGPFDLVAANLPRDVQQEKAAELDRLAAPFGRIILSGFRDNREKLLAARYRTLGWTCRRRRIKEFRHPELPPDISFTWVAWLLEREK